MGETRDFQTSRFNFIENDSRSDLQFFPLDFRRYLLAYVRMPIWSLRSCHSASISKEAKEREPGIEAAATLWFRKFWVAPVPLPNFFLTLQNVS